LYLDGPDDKVVTFFSYEKAAEDIILDNPLIPELSGRSVHELMTIERLATEQALKDVGRPSETVLLPSLDAHSLGQLILLSELETTYVGEWNDINPFNQPAVELIKKNVRHYLSKGLPPAKKGNYLI